MRKPAFCICENKDADQLGSYCAASQLLCFRYADSTTPLLSQSEISSHPFCGYTALLMSDLAGNPEDRIPRVADHMSC